MVQPLCITHLSAAFLIFVRYYFLEELMSILISNTLIGAYFFSLERHLYNSLFMDNMLTLFRYTPLMFAALSGNVPTVRCLLEACANPDILNSVNRTAAQLA